MLHKDQQACSFLSVSYPALLKFRRLLEKASFKLARIGLRIDQTWQQLDWLNNSWVGPKQTGTGNRIPIFEPNFPLHFGCLCSRLCVYFTVKTPSAFKNAPTCYRAPRWPDPEFHEKYRKNTPRAEILEPQENTPKYRKNTKNAHFWYFGAIFSVFSGYFGVISGSPEFRAGGIFSVFFVEIPGRAISGLCSRSGRSQLCLEAPEFEMECFVMEGLLWKVLLWKVLLELAKSWLEVSWMGGFSFHSWGNENRYRKLGQSCLLASVTSLCWGVVEQSAIL